MSPADALIVSCYELGRQPVAAASAAAFLERAGHRVALLDLSVESPERLERIEEPGRVRLVAVSVPMHTALHTGARALARIRAALPDAHVCFFGLYAALNSDHLLDGLCDSTIGGEFEGPLVELARALAENRALDAVRGLCLRGRPAKPHLERLSYPVPERRGLPPLERYARLEIGGESRIAAAVEATRGCLHLCRHCPIPPVYGGRFFVVPRDVVLEDIRRVVASGARHVTFADADFFNGPGHVMGIVRDLHAEWPDLTFDVTTKVENVLKHGDRLGELAASGCVFLVTAVESLSNVVLDHLRKGHGRDEVFEASRRLRDAGISMRPSLVSFTPWTTIDDYLDVLDWVERESLVDQIDAVQYSIRLLVPPGSMLLDADALWPHLRGLAPARLSYAWEHPDPGMDRLHAEVSAIVQDSARRNEPAARAFRRVRDAAYAAAGRIIPPTRTLPARTIAPPPRLTEPWFC